MIDPQDLVPPLYIKSRNWGLMHTERPIFTKFNIKACMLSLNVITENNLDRSKESGTSHIDQIEMLGIWNVQFSQNLIFGLVY